MSAIPNTERPVAFFHQDGIVPAWNYAAKYAGKDGHIATLPEIIEMRLGTPPGTNDSPWENWYVSASAEYLGVGADGRIKVIVAHGVGPMATIDGIKAAYKWEYRDKSGQRNGGRITAQQFLDLEAGKYGEVSTFDTDDTSTALVSSTIPVTVVNVLDLQWYLTYQRKVLRSHTVPYLTATKAAHDPLLKYRLGPRNMDYLQMHERIARRHHKTERPNASYAWCASADDNLHPYITEVELSTETPYADVKDFHMPFDEWEWVPRAPDEGHAVAHLLYIDQLTRVRAAEVGAMLMSAPSIQEWRNNVKFVAVPKDASFDGGISNGPNAKKLLREHWQHFMEPVPQETRPLEPYRLLKANDVWFTYYAKQYPDQACMDSGELEFHVRSVEQLGGEGTFKTDDDFFLRYSLQQVRDIMPLGANAYEVIDISKKDGRGMTTVTLRFYRADVDTARRLPREDTIARNYDRLMEVFTE